MGKKDKLSPTIDEVKKSLPFYGLFDFPAMKHTILELDTISISNEVQWLRRYYRKWKFPSDLQRIRELKEELKRREANALDN